MIFCTRSLLEDVNWLPVARPDWLPENPVELRPDELELPPDWKVDPDCEEEEDVPDWKEVLPDTDKEVCRLTAVWICCCQISDEMPSISAVICWSPFAAASASILITEPGSGVPLLTPLQSRKYPFSQLSFPWQYPNSVQHSDHLGHPAT